MIEACFRQLKGIKQIAVFDTAFHQSMPDKAKMYGLPYSYYKEGLRKYGFHGISYSYILSELRSLLGKIPKKVIICHLGNGASICAIKNGKSIDTSMGFTPLEGLVMATRAGNVDFGLILHILKNKDISIDSLYGLLNKKSGLLGISGISYDLREIIPKRTKNKRAMLAIDVFVYNIAKYIGSYISALKGIDALIFTAGIGRNPYIREKVVESLSHMGIKIDKKLNKKADDTGISILSSKNSKAAAYYIKTNEELMINREINRILGK